tara:strand:+ start:3649 stop:4098 length:450 start_codon:yes stop_codon:yes gene_type:complete
MSLQNRLQDDLKKAMIERDKVRKNVIRFVRSVIHDREIERKQTLDDEAVIDVLGKQAQQRRDSIEAFEQGNRPELVAKEKAELDVILEYLPKQFTEDEVRKIVLKAIEGFELTGPKDMGKVMSTVMPELKGRAEGKTVSSIVMQLLNSV